MIQRRAPNKGRRATTVTKKEKLMLKSTSWRDMLTEVNKQCQVSKTFDFGMNCMTTVQSVL